MLMASHRTRVKHLATFGWPGVPRFIIVLISGKALFLLALANPEHLGAADGTDSLCCWLTVLHGN